MMLKGAKIWPGSARLGSGPARLRLGSGLARPRLGSGSGLGSGSSIAPFIQCVKLYYIKSSGKIRKQGELCPDFGFFFCGKGACC